MVDAMSIRLRPVHLLSEHKGPLIVDRAVERCQGARETPLIIKYDAPVAASDILGCLIGIERLAGVENES